MDERAAIEALDAYLDNPHCVPHALLLHGPWGAGKTTFLRDTYFGQHRKDVVMPGTTKPDKPIWVSFFGLAEVTDLQRRIREESIPIGSHLGPIAGIGLDVLASLLSIQGSSQRAKDYVKQILDPQLLNRVFVFDDVERADGNLIPLLGFVNQIVETHCGRVILIANEDELIKRKDAEWDRRAEKLVGRRLSVVPNVPAVMARFLNQKRDAHVQTYLEAATETVCAVFRASETGNLRSLTWALEAVEKVLRAAPEGTIPNNVLHKIAAQVSASVIALRAGQVKNTDLINHDTISWNMVLSGNREDTEGFIGPHTEEQMAQERWQAFDRRYSSFLLGAPAIDYETIITLESSGYVDPMALRQSLMDRFGYGRDAPPAWRRLWKLPFVSLQEAENAVQELSCDLIERRYRNVGEILHAAGVAISLAEEGEMRPSGGQPVEAFFADYLNEQSQAGVLDYSILDGNESSSYFLDRGYDSLEYQAKETATFQAIKRRVRELFQEDLRKKADEQAEAVIAAAESGNLQPWRAASSPAGKSEMSALDREPGFISLDPDRVARLVMEHDAGPGVPMNLLLMRHDMAGRRDNLTPELDWVSEVASLVLERLGTSPSAAGRILAKRVREMIVSHDKEQPLGRRVLQDKVKAEDGDQ